MCYNVSANRFFIITSIRACSRIGRRHNLIRNDDGNAVLMVYSKYPYQGLSFNQPPTSSASLCKVRRNFARCICRAESSPLPLKSVRYKAVQESTIKRENLFVGLACNTKEQQTMTYLDSDINALAVVNNCCWWSAL